MHIHTAPARSACVVRPISCMLCLAVLLLFAPSSSRLAAQGPSTIIPPHNAPAPSMPNFPPPPPPPLPPGSQPPNMAPGSRPPNMAPRANPSTAPQVLYESAPTTQSVTQVGGAVPPKGAETLPTQAPEGPRTTMIVRQMDIDQFFNQLREKTGVRVKAMGQTRGQKIDLMARSQTVEEILNQIATPRGWIWVQRPDGTYELYDKDTYVRQVQSQQVIRQIFQLRYIDAEELQKIIQPILTPELGAVAVDARSNKLIVTDLPSKIALIQSIVQEYDVQLYTRVFEIRHAKTQDIADRLDEVKSKSAELIVDPTNHQIIAKDTFDKIKIMEQLVNILDREVEMKVYNLTNIGDQGKDATDFIDKFIKPLTTEDAILEYNPSSSKLIVRDVHSVQEKILEVLHQVDVPRKQVRIEGEIVSVMLSNDFSLGTDWVLSHNLTSAIRANQPGATSFNQPSSTASTGTGTGTTGTGTTPNAVAATVPNSAFAKTIEAGLPLATIGSAGLSVINLTDDYKVQLTAALTDKRTRLLLRPRLLISNGQEGSFAVTREEPILQTYFSYNNVNDNQNNTNSAGQQLLESGLTVTIRPNISNRGLVEMEVEFENSASFIVPNIGNNIRGVGKTAEQAKTILVVPSGQTRVIGGLISRDHEEDTSGVPLLSEIPWIGFLFGKKDQVDTMRNLMFFITPTIVDERPQNDLIVEPVNEVARLAMQQATQGAPVPPKNLNEIPRELVPYLQKARPEALPMPLSADQATTVSTVQTDEGTTVSVNTIEAPVGGNTAAAGSRLLSNEPFKEPVSTAAELKVGGAVQLLSTGPGAGPSGVFGGGAAGKGAGKARAATHAPTRPSTRAVSPAGPTRDRRSRLGRGSSTMGGGMPGTETRY